MTVRRDLDARNVKFLLQADGTGGALRDHARSNYLVTANDFATVPGDQLFGVNSFTGQPSLATPGASVLSRTFTVELWTKLAVSGGPQTLLSALSGTYYLPTEWGLTIDAGSRRSIDFYNGVRGQSEAHMHPQMAADWPIGSWVHMFICSTPTQVWMGVDGVMGSAQGTGFVSDHIGSSGISLRFNNTDPALVNQINQGKIHSIMATDGVIRYPYNTSGAYTPPDDLFTNWYQDTGAANDPLMPNEIFYPVLRTAQGERAFHRGDKKIAGHVTYSGLNSARRVALFDRGSQQVIDSTVSRAADGYFEFVGLEAGREYFVIGYDDVPGSINAEVADHLVPV